MSSPADHSLVHPPKRTLLADQDAVARDDPGHVALKHGNADQEQSKRHGPECRRQRRAARGPAEKAGGDDQQDRRAGACPDQPFPERGSLGAAELHQGLPQHPWSAANITTGSVTSSDKPVTAMRQASVAVSYWRQSSLAMRCVRCMRRYSMMISPVMPSSAWVLPSAPLMSQRRSLTRPAATGTSHHSAAWPG